MNPQPYLSFTECLEYGEKISAYSGERLELSVYLDGHHSALIVLPTPEALDRRAIERVEAEYEERLTTLRESDARGLLGRLKGFRDAFFSREGRLMVSGTLQIFGSITIWTMTPTRPLALTVIEADGDIITRLPEGAAHAWSEDLARLHQSTVRYAMGLWREKLRMVKEMVRLGAQLYRVFMVISGGSLVLWPLAYGASRPLAAASLGFSLLTFLLSRRFREFNF